MHKKFFRSCVVGLILAAGVNSAIFCEATTPEIDALVQDLGSNSASKMDEASHALVALGSAAVSAVVSRLSAETDSRVQYRLLQVLGRIGPDAKAAAPALVALLRDTTAREMRDNVVAVLQKTGADDDETINVLIDGIYCDYNEAVDNALAYGDES